MTATQDIPIGLYGASDEVIAKFFQLVKQGESPRMAEILATRSAPGLKTDATYFAGTKRLGDIWGDDHTKEIVKDARRHGYNPTGNEVYNPTMARFRGDPQAFISHMDGRDTVKKHCEKNGISIPEEGIYNERRVKPAQARDVAPDIVRNEIRQRLKNKDVDKPQRMVEDAVKTLTLRKKKRK